MKAVAVLNLSRCWKGIMRRRTILDWDYVPRLYIYLQSRGLSTSRLTCRTDPQRDRDGWNRGNWSRCLRTVVLCIGRNMMWSRLAIRCSLGIWIPCTFFAYWKSMLSVRQGDVVRSYR